MRQRFLPLVQTAAVLALLSCAAPTVRRDNAASALARNSEVEARVQAETAYLRAEIGALQTALAERERREVDLWRAHVALMQRVDHLIELQQHTEPVVSTNPEVPINYQSVSLNAESPQFLKAMVRAINRLELNSEQKRALIQMLFPPRQIDGINPWNGGSEWHNFGSSAR